MDADMTAPGFERIVPKYAPLDRIAYGLQFGEGPVWNARQGSLLWVDIVGDTIWKLYITTGGGHLYRVRNTGRQGWLLFPAVQGD
jgi:sugar lactone lactonase YvrE